MLYLASDAAGFVTGTHLVVDGGKTVGTRASWDRSAQGTVQEVLGLSSEALEALMVQGDAAPLQAR